jgi:hypothetical protein
MLFLAGLGCACAMLIRPIALGLPFVFAIFLWLRHRNVAWTRRLAGVAFLALGSLCLVLPWEAWIFRHTGRIEVLSSNGFPSVLDGLTYSKESPERRSLSIPGDVARFTRDLIQESDERRIETMTGLMSWMVTQLKERPWTVLKVYAIKACRCWFGSDSHYHESESLLIGAIFLIGVIVASYRALWMGGPPRDLALLVLAITLYNWLMSILVLSNLRYMVPVEALLFTLYPALLSRNGT